MAKRGEFRKLETVIVDQFAILNKSIIALVSTMDNSGKQKEKLERAAKARFAEENSLTAQSIKGLNRLVTTFDLGLWSKLSNSVIELDKLQRVSLSMGKDLNSVIGENSKTLKDFAGSYGDAASVQVHAYKAGMRSFNKDITHLGVRMKLTGEDIGSLLSLYSGIKTTGLLHIDALGRLSKHVEGAADKYHTSTGTLIEAMNSLGSIMLSSGALGISEKILKLQTELVAQLGAGSTEVVSTMLKQFTSPGIMADIYARMVGPAATELRRLIMSGNQVPMKQLTDASWAAAKEARLLRDTYVKEGEFRGLGYEIYTNLVKEGNVALASMNVALENLTEEDKKIIASTEKLNSSLKTLKAEFFEPLVKFGESIVTWTSDHVSTTKSLIGTLIALALAIKLNTMATTQETMAKLSGGAGFGAGMHKGMGRFGRIGAGIGMLGAALGGAGFLYSLYKENRDANNHLKMIKIKTEALVDLEEKKKVKEDTFLGATSNLLKSILQVQALRPEYATTLAMASADEQREATIKLQMESNLLLRKIAEDL